MPIIVTNYIVHWHTGDITKVMHNKPLPWLVKIPECGFYASFSYFVEGAQIVELDHL